ncbi:MAG: two-component system, OmpR family, osmolarity sensor histidine kinase EnvZ [Pseudomonadota bacterium]|nr:two-component system, OmpR family, osmolarity sensor histidine kinase EnvZ [Pseudomonadota bacterium]
MVPRTLLVRTFLLVSALIVMTVSIWATLFEFASREPRARQLAQLTASAANLTLAALIAADPAKRRDLLVELSEREGIRLYPAEPEDVIEELPDDGFYEMFRTEIRKMLGSHTRLAFAVNGEEGIWASFQLDDSEDDEFWVMLPRERADRDFPWHWLNWGAASLALALFVAWWIVSRVTRPLRALAAAAAEVGRGRNPEPVAVTGADELKQVASAFNQMSDDLSRIENERAEVLAGISHDLRTPLARLRLEAEMSVPDASAREAITADIEQMDAIIAQFLDYARASSDEAMAATDIRQLLEEIAARYARLGAPLQLDYQALPEIAETMLRPLAIRRAIGNLIENARKYGGGEITLAAAMTRNQLSIEVNDRGPGIPVEEVERMKQPFTRLENARTDAKGTGLGLAIVERIAKLHGGVLELLPREGGGMTAALSLPLQAAK